MRHRSNDLRKVVTKNIPMHVAVKYQMYKGKSGTKSVDQKINTCWIGMTTVLLCNSKIWFGRSSLIIDTSNQKNDGIDVTTDINTN